MDSDLSDRLLRALSTCAGLIQTNRPAALPFLRHAAALHWHIYPDTVPMTPSEVEERLSWPLESWLDASIRGPYTGPLNVGGFSSPVCDDIALEVDNRLGQELVQQVIQRVRDTCRLREEGQSQYVRFRSYLIEHPTANRDLYMQNLLIGLGVDVNALYIDIPEHLKRGVRFFPCPSCGWPMNLNVSPVTCGSSWCAAKHSLHGWSSNGLVNNSTAKPATTIASGTTMMLRTAIWKFTLIPGLLELSLLRRIESTGLPVVLWPDVDSADIEVTVNDAPIRIDAKVWRSARMLARHLKTLTMAQPGWVVVPDYQARDINFLRENCPAQIEVLTEKACIKKLKQLCKR